MSQASVTINGISALEMTMRDVLDGMEDLALAYAFESDTAEFEILSIEPPEKAATDRATEHLDQLGAA